MDAHRSALSDLVTLLSATLVLFFIPRNKNSNPDHFTTTKGSKVSSISIAKYMSQENYNSHIKGDSEVQLLIKYLSFWELISSQLVLPELYFLMCIL